MLQGHKMHWQRCDTQKTVHRHFLSLSGDLVTLRLPLWSWGRSMRDVVTGRHGQPGVVSKMRNRPAGTLEATDKCVRLCVGFLGAVRRWWSRRKGRRHKKPCGCFLLLLLRHVIPSQWSLWRSKHTELGSNLVLVAASEILALPDAAHHLAQLVIENLFQSNNQSDVWHLVSSEKPSKSVFTVACVQTSSVSTC